MATKNLLNVDWDAYDDDFYDEFIEEETTRKLRIKNKDRSDSAPKPSKKNNLSSKINKKDYIEDNSSSDNAFNPVLSADFIKDISSEPVNETKKSRNEVQKPIISPKPAQDSPKQPIILGENTKDIKGNKIDFDRLANIEKIDGEYKGNQTFGIKFFFKGNKGLFRIVWYNRNMYERDHAFQEYYNFWKSLGY